jgi:hypothetical protein
MSVPGNAYVSQTGGNFTAPASPAAVALTAATAKTVLTLTVGTNNQPAITELGVSCDGASGTLLIELGLLTAATAGTGTTSACAAAGAWLAAVPVAAHVRVQLHGRADRVHRDRPAVAGADADAPLAVCSFRWVAKPTGIITAATAGKMIGVRLTSSIGANARVYIEHEE